MVKVATWNVNSVVARKERLLAFLARAAPDVLCLQELKCLDEKFPFAEVEAAGYHAATHGQKTYNGVAVLSKTKPDDVLRGFGDESDDDQARFLAARFGDLTVMSAYVPNGQFVGSEKYAYKLEWLRRLRKYLGNHHKPTDKLLLTGDFNIAPRDLDVHDPTAWHEKILCSTPERQALKQLEKFGLKDVGATLDPEKKQFTWWDYRMLGFPKNHGLRIDLVLASDPCLAAAKTHVVDRDERKGDKASDHAPVIVDLEI